METLFYMVFGRHVSPTVLAQWCNQGFRFSPHPETSFGIVQHEGGPCGVLAPLQATLMKYLLFMPGNVEKTLKPAYDDAERTSALIEAMAEILWRAGEGHKAVLAFFDVPEGSEEEQEKILERVISDSGDALGACQAVKTLTVLSLSALHDEIQSKLCAFRSRMGALLFLFSAILSRGLDAVQNDRDDAEQPLVTLPFGHASQEIVNLLLCGQAVAHVFDGNYDLGGGMNLKGIPSHVEVGFLTLLESMNFCTVGDFLKRPNWPVWVVGSESHYTVLFALETSVQEEKEVDARESNIRRAFDAHDRSGGGGFIEFQALQEVLFEADINMPPQLLDRLSGGIVVWDELYEALQQLGKNSGGLKADGAKASGRGEMKRFTLYHFNGIAKSSKSSSSSLTQGHEQLGQEQMRPRLTKVKVAVPPKWTPESVMFDPADDVEEPAQHAPLVDCIRSRWQRAFCNWTGDTPSIV